MPLDEWRKGNWTDPNTGVSTNINGGETLSHMEEAVFKYLSRDIDHRYDTYAAPKLMLAQVAERLVRQRMARRNFAEKGIGGEKLYRRWQSFNGALFAADVRRGSEDRPILHPVKKASIASVMGRSAAAAG